MYLLLIITKSSPVYAWGYCSPRLHSIKWQKQDLKLSSLIRVQAFKVYVMWPL